jgi:integrase
MKRRGNGDGTIFKPKGSRYWWIAYVSGGKRRFESSKSERKSDAQALLGDRIGDIKRGLVVTPKLGRKTLAEGLKSVMDDMRMNGRDSVVCSRCHVVCDIEGHTNAVDQQIKHLLRRFLPDGKVTGHFAPERLMSTITTSDLTAYAAQRLAQGAAASTINHELAVVRRAFRLAVRARELATMPHVPMLALNNARRGFFERAEFDAVLAHLPEHLRAPLTFAYVTGWRVKSEVLPLTADRVDLPASVVRLDPGTTKSGEGRTFYVTATLRKVLTAQLDSLAALKQEGTISPFVFHNADGSRIKDLRKAWKAACEAASVPGKLLHDFRRTAVRNLERAGVPRSTAMAMVGHKTESIYRRYAIVDEQMHREAAAKLEAWTDEQQTRAKAAQRGQVARFRRRQAK